MFWFLCINVYKTELLFSPQGPPCFCWYSVPSALKLAVGSSLSFSHSTHQAPSPDKCAAPSHCSTLITFTVSLSCAVTVPTQYSPSCRLSPTTTASLIFHRHSLVHIASLCRGLQWHLISSYTESVFLSPAFKASHALFQPPLHPCCGMVLQPALTLQIPRELKN